MATKKDKTSLAAQKARKQKIIAIAGGVLLLGLVAIQGPKLWKQLNPPAPAQTTASVAPATVPAVSGAATPTLNTPPTGSTTTVVLAGVSIPSGTAAPRAQEGKLLSFSLFETKDPFVPQGSDASSATATGATGGRTSSASTSGQIATSGTTAPPVSLPKPTYAEIELNGKTQQLGLKERFPKTAQTFVLVALTRSVAKIGVVGGAFQSGKTLELQLGRQATLVDAKTGAHYTLRFVYAGTQPEKTEAFTSASTAGTSTKTTTP